MRVQYQMIRRIMDECPESLDEVEIMIGDSYSIFGYLREYLEIGRFGMIRKQPECPFWVGDCDIPDGASFPTAEELVNAPLYKGRSLREVWDEVDIICAAGMPPEIWLEQMNIPGIQYDAAQDLWYL